MIWLAVAGLLIAGVSVWYLVRPLTQAAPAVDREREHQLELLRGRLLVQLNELDLEEADRNMDPTVLADERARLEAELAQVLRELESVADRGKKQKESRDSRRAWLTVLVILGLALPLSAAGLYALTQRTTLAHLASVETLTDDGIPPMVKEMVARLENRLREQPDDADGWSRLGRAYAVMGRGEEANAAYARAYKLNPNDANLVAEYAGFLYQGDPLNMGAQVLGLFKRLHELEPQNRDALWVLGFAAYQKTDYRKALGYWESLQKTLPPESQEAEHLRQIVAKTRAQMKKK